MEKKGLSHLRHYQDTNVKVLVGAFNQEKGLVGALYVIVKYVKTSLMVCLQL